METPEASSALAVESYQLARSLTSIAASSTPEALQPAATSLRTGNQSSSSMIAQLGHWLYVLISIVPGFLYWLITFATITLPTWLFAIFSMSLTFTMNFTTL